MPVKKQRIHRDPPELAGLRERLTAEWNSPSNDSKAPVIIEQSGAAGQTVRICVVWDEWRGVDPARRSEVVMDAFEEVRGRDAALDVSYAMALTAAEADHLGIDWR